MIYERSREKMLQNLIISEKSREFSQDHLQILGELPGAACVVSIKK